MTARSLLPRWLGAATRAGAAALVLAVLAVGGIAGRSDAAATSTSAGRSAPDTGPTVVSLTFDDGDADQMTAANMMASYGLPGTFYIIPGAVGTPNYLTRSQLKTLVTNGNEIGAHTVSHLELTRVSSAEARRQLCQSRNILRSWGFKVRSLAYPNGGFDPALERTTQQCGFTSARTIKGLTEPGCPKACPAVESIPPAKPYAIRAAGEVARNWKVGDLERLVVNASRRGDGWVPFVFHHICAGSNCGEFTISPSALGQFLAWLNLRQQLNLNRVQTVSQVVGGRERPRVSVPAAAPHGVVQPSLEETAPSPVSSDQETIVASGFPACWQPGDYGSNDVTWRRVHQAHSGRWAEKVTMRNHTSGDAKLLQRFDLGQCALAVDPDHDYALHAWYRATTRVQFSVYYRNSDGRWFFWKASPYYKVRSTWTRANWRLPALPRGATAISYGLAIGADGWLITDDYSFGPRSSFRDPTPLFGAGLLFGTTLLTMRSRIRRRQQAP